MDCSHYDAGQCASCTLITLPYSRQLQRKVQSCAHILRAHIANPRDATLAKAAPWLPAVASKEVGFRNKAKLAVEGTAQNPTLGILDATFHGVDLAQCRLYPPAISATFGPLKEFIRRANLEPYHVKSRTGELKHLLITASEHGELMVRFVLRSTEAQARITKYLPQLQAQLPLLHVVSLNIQPEPKAIVEGAREIVLTPASALCMPVGDVNLYVQPQSFFQTNTEVAAQLYTQVAQWVNAADAQNVWDLYCGVGGFALHCAAPGRHVTGIEISESAIESAQRSARELTELHPELSGRFSFHAGDAATRLTDSAHLASSSPPAGVATLADTIDRKNPARPDVVIVNPPRRGIGEQLSGWLEESGIETVVYSSCNPKTLAQDLDHMPSYRVSAARVFDMFPHTDHVECAVLLVR